MEPGHVHLSELLKKSADVPAGHRSTLLAVMASPGKQAYLAKRAGLSEATVSGAVRELERKQWVRTETTGREKFVQMVPTTGAAVGIELGFHLSAVVTRRVEQSHHEALFRRVGIGAAAGPGRWVTDVAEAVRDAVTELGEQDIAAIGLGVPRMVDPKDGRLVPPALPPWREGEDPADLLAGALRSGRGTPRLLAPKIVLDNDANLAAYAESAYESKEAETLVAIKASTGIGAGIVVSGKIFRGRRGIAGEIGHTVVRTDGPFCSCGGRGCLESIIGADALVEQAKSVLGHHRQDSPEKLEELVNMAARGNLACQRVLQEAAVMLGSAIGNLCNLLSPDVVVLGGAFGRDDAVRFTLESCREAVRRSAMTAAVAPDGVTIRPSAIPYAAAHGALLVALEGTEY